jgi:magnesium transporter
MIESQEHNIPKTSPENTDSGDIYFYGFNKDKEEIINNLLDEDNFLPIQEMLQDEHPADIADYITSLSNDNKKKIIGAIANNFNPEILLSFERVVRANVIDILGTDATIKILEAMDIDDVVYVIQDLDHDEQEYLVANLHDEMRLALKESFSYPENSAGRLMQKKFVSVMEYWTAEQCIKYTRNNRNLPEDFYEMFVLDVHHKPIGSLLASKLLCSPDHVKVGKILGKNFKVIETNLDQEEVSYLFKQYDLLSAPVVNKAGRLVGVITVDDIVDVIEEEAEEDILYSAGIRSFDIHSSFFEAAKNRLPWLIINIFIATMTSQVIQYFEGTIAKLVLLAAVMPIVASIGGNAGTQSLTVAVRALASKEINDNNQYRVILKEIMTCMLNGLVLAMLGSIFVFIVYGNFSISVIFALSVFINLIIAGLFGAFIPIILNRFGADPAVSSGIFLTGTTDISGFFIFLILARYLIPIIN